MNRSIPNWLAVCLILAVVSFALVTTGCARRQSGPPSPIRPAKIRVGTWKTAQTIAPFCYDQFLPEGFSAEIFPFTNPGDQKTALLAGSLDICGTTIVHAIVSASKGEPIVYVSSLCDKCSALVVKKGAGIKSPADLRGKTIGYVPSTMHDVLLRETLTKAGLDPNRDVKLTRVDFFDMGQALATGGIDAFCSGEPYPTIAVLEGYGEILSYPYYGESIGTINGGMITTQDMIAKHRDLVQAAVTAHARASEYLMAHQDEWLKRSEEFGNRPDVLRESAKNMVLAWEIDKEYIRHAKVLGERMQALGMINRQPDWNALFDTSFVEQARREIGKGRGVSR